MNKLRLIPCLIALLAITPAHAESPVSVAAAEALGWKLGMQAYTFKSVSFFEAVDKNVALGMKYIEVFPNQRISPDSDATMHYSMSPEDRQRVLAKMREAGVAFNGYGVVRGKGEEDWRAIFAFAKALGIPTLVSEPALEELDTVERLADEFSINVAFHNHPEPSLYWNPDTLLAAIEGRSARLGACADTGHWMRSGLDPLECLKKLEGRIISFHFKDLDKAEASGTAKAARTAHDVPWGTGAGNSYALLREMKRQGFKGGFSIEYEHNWDQAEPEIAQCVRYFHLAANALHRKGFGPMLKEDLSNASCEEGAWVFEDGILTPRGPGSLFTKEQYGDFVLKLSFKCAEDTNSGVFLRTADIAQAVQTAFEVQILQPVGKGEKQNCGALYDCLAPSKILTKPVGKWNHFTIIAHENLLLIILNGEQVVYADLDLWTEAGMNPDGTKNKFKTAYKDMARVGYLGLQYHKRPIWFQNMRVKKL